VREGWYLMSTSELERALAAWRNGDRSSEFGVTLSVEEALARRDAGNVPGVDDRSLRLVMFVDDEPLERKRLMWEPDFHDAPDWRRPGSRPVNVVPLRSADSPAGDTRPWWETPRMEALEEEWRREGSILGIEVPGEYRSFVFKTVVALQDAGREVTPDSISDSIARWLQPEDVEKIRPLLKEKGPG
jgi:hypothetical protein